MVEPVGLTISILTLGSVFETALHGFERIRFGQNLAVDITTCTLRLDNLYLQLTRWGEAVGLGGDTKTARSLERASLPRRDVKQAEALLGHIVELFSRAEQTSTKYREEHESTDTEVIDRPLGEADASLHQRMRDICHRRQRKLSKTKTAQWALYEREHFHQLIGDIQQLVKDLVELFPAALQQERALCEGECVEMRDETSLRTLEEIAKEQDGLLGEALARLGTPKVAATHVWNNSDNTKVANQVAGDQTFHGGQTFSF